MVKNTAIEPLKGPDRVRKRPSVLFGSDDERGCEKMIRMLIDFGFCEYVIEQADQIAVIKCEDGSYIVENNGGSVVPVEAASCNNGGTVTGWEEIFCGEPTECNPPPGKAAYFNRKPIFGFEKYFARLALFAGNAASSYMTVDVVRNGWKYTLCFQKGRLAKPIEKERFPGECGLCLHFLPDAEVFTSTDFDFADIFEYAAGQAALHPGLSLSVKDASSAPVKKKNYCYDEGFCDYLADKLELSDDQRRDVLHFHWRTVIDDEITIYRWHNGKYRRMADDIEVHPAYTVGFEIAFVFSPGKNLRAYFHNFERLEHGGVLCSAISESIDSIRNQYKEKGMDTDGAYRDISVCVSSLSTRTSWTDEKHTGIANTGIYDHLGSVVRRLLAEYYDRSLSAQSSGDDREDL